MRPLILIGMLVVLASCGSNDRASTSNSCAGMRTDLSNVLIEGTWTMVEGSNVARVTFNSDCSGTLQGLNTLSSQAASFSYSQPSLGALPVTVHSTTGGYAFPPSTGSLSCSYNDTTADTLVIDCGDGGHTYRR